MRGRLARLASCLNGRDHLVESFSAADILMTSVLRILRHTELEEEPVLVAYKQRYEARPAFTKALADQMAEPVRARASAASPGARSSPTTPLSSRARRLAPKRNTSDLDPPRPM